MNFLSHTGPLELAIVAMQPGEMLLESIREALAQRGLRNGVVVSGIGTLKNLRLHCITHTDPPPKDEIINAVRSLELLNVAGIVADGEPRLHVVVSCGRDEVYAGHLEDGGEVAYLAEIAILQCNALEMTRRLDEARPHQAARGEVTAPSPRVPARRIMSSWSPRGTGRARCIGGWGMSEASITATAPEPMVRDLPGQRPDVRSRQSANVGSGERVVSAVAGMALGAMGLRRRGLLGWLMAASGAALVAHGAKKHCAVYDRIGVTGEDAEPTSNPLDRRVHIRRSVTVERPADELYRFWRSVEKLPQFMQPIESVEAVDDRLSRWTAHLPVVGRVQWLSRIVEDVPNERIAWRTEGDSFVEHDGAVEFHPTGPDRESRVTLEMVYQLTGGAVAAGLAKLLGKSPSDYASRNLHRFRQLMETGEVATNEGPSGRE